MTYRQSYTNQDKPSEYLPTGIFLAECHKHSTQSLEHDSSCFSTIRNASYSTPVDYRSFPLPTSLESDNPCLLLHFTLFCR